MSGESPRATADARTGVDHARVRSGMASADLLRAQLRHGQHVLELSRARTIALAIGLSPMQVRRGIGDRMRVAH